MSIDGVDGLISGGIKAEDHAETTNIHLLPGLPVWAQLRPVQLQLVRRDERLTVTIFLGPGLPPMPGVAITPPN